MYRARAARANPGIVAAVSNQVSEQVARGWELLEAGDLDGARAALEQARELADRDVNGRSRGADGNPELLFLGAVIAEHEGDVEKALEDCLRAHMLDPEEFAYLLGAAELAMNALEDPVAALAMSDRALELATEDDELIAALLIKAEALVSMGNPEGEDSEAREILDELAGCAIDDPGILCRLGDLRMALGDVDAAAAAYTAAAKEDASWADAFHGLGLVYQERGDHEDMVQAWLQVRALDLAAPLPSLHLDADEFERIASNAMAELPQEAIDRLANVPVFVEDLPSEELIREGTDPRLLGLFAPEKPSMEGQALSLNAIYLFQRNLERECASPDELAEEIRITVLHETAHFFGLDDDDLEGMGLA